MSPALHEIEYDFVQKVSFRMKETHCCMSEAIITFIYLGSW